MNNLLSYCGLTDSKIRASDTDLPAYTLLFQDGSTQQLKPYNRRSSRATLRPLSRKDIFYSGSVYNLALEMQEQKMMTDQSLLKGRVLNP